MTAVAESIDRERIADLCLAMTAISSPTGHERPLAEWIVGHLTNAGIAADIQVFEGTRANVVARRVGSGGGAAVLLYSPIDTAFPIEASEPFDPAIAGANPALTPGAFRSAGWIVGPGAENPKGYAAAVISAFQALNGSELDLRGDVVLALTAGGMPSPGLPGSPGSEGLGRGCREFLASYPRPDVAVIAKPGDAVSVEEAGIALFKVRVIGDLGYTGTRHRAPLRHALLDAAHLIERLEAWFPIYTAAQATTTVSPQGAVTAVAGGWPSQPAFLPPVCDVWVDMRVAVGVSLDVVEASLQRAVDDAASGFGSEVVLERLGGFPGAATARDAWIVRAAIRAWESRTGRIHSEATSTSGVTDASILRGHGIPTARIGMPRPTIPSPYPGFSMGVVDIDSIAALARTLVEIVMDATRRPRAEVVDQRGASMQIES